MTAESGQDIGKAKIYAILGHYLLDRDQNWRRPSDEGPGDWMPVYQGELILGHLAYPLSAVITLQSRISRAIVTCPS